jgi:hypothetical protein
MYNKREKRPNLGILRLSILTNPFQWMVLREFFLMILSTTVLLQQMELHQVE